MGNWLHFKVILPISGGVRHTVFSKVFEKVAYTQLYDYFENNSILHKQQYEFRAKKSTTHAILHFLQYLYSI